MASKSFAAVKNEGHTLENIRKALEMVVLVRRWDPAGTPVSEALWDGTGLVIPAGFTCLGLTTEKDGATWTRKQDWVETTSHGYSEPTRRDCKSDATGFKVTAQEYKRLTRELSLGQDLSGITPDEHGVIRIDKASIPKPMYWELLGIAKDDDGPDAIYIARSLGKAQVTGVDDEKWGPEEEIQTPLEFAALVDKRTGTSMTELIFGPGVDHEAMGFPVPVGP